MTLDYPYIQKTLDAITPISADMGGRHSDLALYSGGQPGQAFYISTSTSVIAISGGPVKLGANRAIAAA